MGGLKQDFPSASLLEAGVSQNAIRLKWDFLQDAVPAMAGRSLGRIRPRRGRSSRRSASSSNRRRLMSMDRKNAAILESLRDLFNSMGRLFSALGVSESQFEAVESGIRSAMDSVSGADSADEAGPVSAPAAAGAGRAALPRPEETVRLASGAEVTAEILQDQSKGGRNRWYIELDGRKVLVTQLKKGLWRERTRTTNSFANYAIKQADVDLLARLAELGADGHKPVFRELVERSADKFSRGQVLGRMRVLRDAGFVSKSDDERLLLTDKGRAVPGVLPPPPKPASEKARPKPAPRAKSKPRRTRAPQGQASTSSSSPAEKGAARSRKK
jgi:hypothetical protein